MAQTLLWRGKSVILLSYEPYLILGRCMVLRKSLLESYYG